jgi:hypothetical protein
MTSPRGDANAAQTGWIAYTRAFGEARWCSCTTGATGKKYCATYRTREQRRTTRSSIYLSMVCTPTRISGVASPRASASTSMLSFMKSALPGSRVMLPLDALANP